MLYWHEYCYVIILGTVISLVLTMLVTWPLLGDVWISELIYIITLLSN